MYNNIQYTPNVKQNTTSSNTTRYSYTHHTSTNTTHHTLNLTTYLSNYTPQPSTPIKHAGSNCPKWGRNIGKGMMEEHK